MAGTYDWNMAEKLHSVPFDALIFAAIMKADTKNMENLMIGFPQLVAEASQHYHGTYGDAEPKTKVSQDRSTIADDGCACAGNYTCSYHKLKRSTR